MFKQKDPNLRLRMWLLKNYDMSILYHPDKTNVVANALTRLLMDNVAHIEENKKELVRDVHILTRLGV